MKPYNIGCFPETSGEKDQILWDKHGNLTPKGLAQTVM